MPINQTKMKHALEITLGKGGQLARAAGAVAKLIAKEGKSATLKLPFGEVRLIATLANNLEISQIGSHVKCQPPLIVETSLQLHTILYLKFSRKIQVVGILSDLPYINCYTTLTRIIHEFLKQTVKIIFQAT
jgi:hypothetical protein